MIYEFDCKSSSLTRTVQRPRGFQINAGTRKTVRLPYPSPTAQIKGARWDQMVATLSTTHTINYILRRLLLWLEVVSPSTGSHAGWRALLVTTATRLALQGSPPP